jgi:MoaA/NifB/PqqE/SkfB family radical SAM enzyme
LRELLEGECGQCINRDISVGCRGRAYEESGNMLASDPGQPKLQARVFTHRE